MDVDSELPVVIEPLTTATVDPKEPLSEPAVIVKDDLIPVATTELNHLPVSLPQQLPIEISTEGTIESSQIVDNVDAPGNGTVGAITSDQPVQKDSNENNNVDTMEAITGHQPVQKDPMPLSTEIMGMRPAQIDTSDAALLDVDDGPSSLNIIPTQGAVAGNSAAHLYIPHSPTAPLGGLPSVQSGGLGKLEPIKISPPNRNRALRPLSPMVASTANGGSEQSPSVRTSPSSLGILHPGVRFNTELTAKAAISPTERVSHRRSPLMFEKKPAAPVLLEDYDAVARSLRLSMLATSYGDIETAKQAFRNTFESFKADSGLVSVSKVLDLVQSQEMRLLGEKSDMEKALAFKLFTEQLYLDGNESIALGDLEKIFWPDEALSVRDKASLDVVAREATIKAVALSATASEDEIVDALVAKYEIRLRQPGNLIENGSVRRILLSLAISQDVGGSLSYQEVNVLMHSFHAGRDLVVKPEDLRRWLLTGAEGYEVSFRPAVTMQSSNSSSSPETKQYQTSSQPTIVTGETLDTGSPPTAVGKNRLEPIKAKFDGMRKAIFAPVTLQSPPFTKSTTPTMVQASKNSNPAPESDVLTTATVPAERNGMLLQVDNYGNSIQHPVKPAALNSAVAPKLVLNDYNCVVKAFKNRLLQRVQGDKPSAKEMTKVCFNSLDADCSGTLTCKEVSDFLLSEELHILEEIDQTEREYYVKCVVTGMDEDCNEQISLKELNDFLWREDSSRETGFLLETAKQAIISKLKIKSTCLPERLMEMLHIEFHMPIRQPGSCFLTSSLTKMFKSLVLSNEDGGKFNGTEINILLNNLDMNKDHIISPREMHHWLFPASDKKLVIAIPEPSTFTGDNAGPMHPKTTPVSSTVNKKFARDTIDIQDYNLAVASLRGYLLDSAQGDRKNVKKIAQSIFESLDEDRSGFVSVGEIKDFLMSTSNILSGMNDEQRERCCDLLVHELDDDSSGTISLAELEQFLWSPSHVRERGILISISRKAIFRATGLTMESSNDDIIPTIAKTFKIPARSGKMFEVNSLIRLFKALNIEINDGGPLDSEEIQRVISSLDSNKDLVVSSAEFKAWLFPSYITDSKPMMRLKTVMVQRYSDVEEFMDDLLRIKGRPGQITVDDFITGIRQLDKSIVADEGQKIAKCVADRNGFITASSISDVFGQRIFNLSPAKLSAYVHQSDLKIDPNLMPVNPHSEQENHGADDKTAPVVVDSVYLNSHYDLPPPSGPAEEKQGNCIDIAIPISTSAASNTIIQDNLSMKELRESSPLRSAEPRSFMDAKHFPTVDIPKVKVSAPEVRFVETVHYVHPGRWMGYPYDTWNCCYTNEIICPKFRQHVRHCQVVTNSMPQRSPVGFPQKSVPISEGSSEKGQKAQKLHSSSRVSPRPTSRPKHDHSLKSRAATTGKPLHIENIDIFYQDEPLTRDRWNSLLNSSKTAVDAPRAVSAPHLSLARSSTAQRQEQPVTVDDLGSSANRKVSRLFVAGQYRKVPTDVTPLEFFIGTVWGTSSRMPNKQHRKATHAAHLNGKAIIGSTNSSSVSLDHGIPVNNLLDTQLATPRQSKSTHSHNVASNTKKSEKGLSASSPLVKLGTSPKSSPISQHQRTNLSSLKHSQGSHVLSQEGLQKVEQRIEAVTSITRRKNDAIYKELREQRRKLQDIEKSIKAGTAIRSPRNGVSTGAQPQLEIKALSDRLIQLERMLSERGNGFNDELRAQHDIISKLDSWLAHQRPPSARKLGLAVGAKSPSQILTPSFSPLHLDELMKTVDGINAGQGNDSHAELIARRELFGEIEDGDGGASDQGLVRSPSQNSKQRANLPRSLAVAGKCKQSFNKTSLNAKNMNDGSPYDERIRITIHTSAASVVPCGHRTFNPDDQDLLNRSLSSSFLKVGNSNKKPPQSIGTSSGERLAQSMPQSNSYLLTMTEIMHNNFGFSFDGDAPTHLQSHVVEPITSKAFNKNMTAAAIPYNADHLKSKQ